MKKRDGFIAELMRSQNIQKDILAFIINKKELLKQLDFKTLMSIRREYSTGLESIMFLIFLAEVSKVIQNKYIKVFILYITQNSNNISIEEFIKSKIPFFNDETFLDKTFHQSLPIFYQYIQDSFRIIFETRYKIAKITEKIGLSSIESNSFRENLVRNEKEELKNSMFHMTNDLYESIFPIYTYLVKVQINSIDAINYQTIEDNQRLIDAIHFYVLFDKLKGFKYLEKLKSKIFMENLYLKSQDNSQELNNLKKEIFDLQQKAYIQENLFDYIQKLQELKLNLYRVQLKYNIEDKYYLNFHEIKELL